MTSITLTAADGHAVPAYVATPEGTPRGGIVVIQEIFGVNGHIREVADGYAAAGYVAVAPAVYARAGTAGLGDGGPYGVELGYTPDDVTRGLEIRAAVALDDVVLDLAAAAEEARHRSAGRVGAVGYCWGGFLATAAAQRLAGTVDAAVGYYGGGIAASLLGDVPVAPLLLHFAENDHAIPLADVDAVRAAFPGVPVHVYAGAQHGFNCDQRASFDATSARVALARTLRFFFTHVG
ncbi:MAG: dienelactone hydrolase family protein [Actinobacteria bacterium]|nr:dienelactone hydrolase family protein [Actinomycetota bacterium]